MERQEWLQWRKQGIGSSDAPVIMGVSPWKTALKLYEEKISDDAPEETSSYITDRGNDIEPRVRSLFEFKMGETFDPALCVMDGFEYLRASLDGRSTDGRRGIEIKLSGREDWDNARKGIVPEKYIPQIQHQNMVAQLDFTYYLSYLYEKGAREMSLDRLVIVEVAPDRDYIGRLVQEEMKFWDCVLKRKPPVASDRDYKRLTGFAKQAAKWKSLKEKFESIEAELESVRAELIAAAEATKHPRLMCGDVRLIQSSRVGAVDYSKIEALKGMNLDPYRKKGSVSWRMEIVEGEEK